MRKVEDRLEALGSNVDRSARFVCTLALCWPDGETALFEGQISGHLTWPPRGELGFGYDPVFYVPAFGCTTAEMDPAQKHAISHRGPALRAMAERLAPPVVDSLAVFESGAVPQYESDTTPSEYHEKVEIAREHIYAGDAFQIVVSQRFRTQTTASALDIYRVLRVSNPSPYMYLIRFPTPKAAAAGRDLRSPGLGTESAFDVVGSSPEALVKLEAGNAMLHPIAGTRPRGTTPEADQQLADDLLADDKERAEHLMLVDLGRNDLGRVSEAGTVEVVEFMQIERYSHVMHIVSNVVGEIRDEETADIAVKAALTGHLVLSTLHTNDAASVFTRLTDMGLEPFLVQSSVALAAAQRLLKCVCGSCKEPIQVPEDVLKRIQFTKVLCEGEPTFVRGRGCTRCKGTGYKGRLAVIEAMPNYPDLQDLVMQRAPAMDIKRMALKCGMRSLRQNALAKAARGLTTIGEVLRTTAAD